MSSYNAAAELVSKNTSNGLADKIAYIDDVGSYSFSDLETRVQRTASAIQAIGLQREQRVLLCMLDSFELPSTFLGCIYTGVIPILTNTVLTKDDYAYMLKDSRARIAIVDRSLSNQFISLIEDVPTLEKIIFSGSGEELSELISSHEPSLLQEETHKDEACFWLYSSGSTGRPKGTVHKHSSFRTTVENYADPVLKINADDILFSAAKLFFAYGLGNALTFPLSAGATTVLMAERPTPESVTQRLTQYSPTVFFGVPTLYAALLNYENFPSKKDLSLRLCTSAGEALPIDLATRWEAQLGVKILDGIGSTEMLHIFLSNKEDSYKYGTTGTPLDGYELKILNESGAEVNRREIGELYVKGESAALMYWNNQKKSRTTFQGEWTRTGDKYEIDDEGFYVYCGRSDDMMKVGGIYVSPTEVENALTTHLAVLEVAVVAQKDKEGLVKPKAYVVLNSESNASTSLEDELKEYVKQSLAPYKYPRWVEFVAELPKTATGKIQRFKLRDLVKTS